MSTGLSRSNPHSPRSRQFRGRSRAASLPLLRCLIRVRITMLADATLSQRQRRPFNACHQPCCSSPMCVEADDDDSGSSGGASVTDGTKRQRVDGMWRTSEGAAPPPHPPLVGNSTAVATALGGATGGTLGGASAGGGGASRAAPSALGGLLCCATGCATGSATGCATGGASGGASGGAAVNESGGASGGAAGNAAHGARGRGAGKTSRRRLGGGGALWAASCLVAHG